MLDENVVEQERKDFLTGLSLRGYLNIFLNKLIISSQSQEKVFSIILFDLDRFKRFNDKYGHPFGDEILKYVASSLRLSFQLDECAYFRYGGDEFILVFPEKGPKEAMQSALRFKYNLTRRPFLFENKFYKITASAGIACFPSDGQTMDQLIQKADEAMYFSKRHGRNRITLAGKINYLNMRNTINHIVGTFLFVTIFLLLYHFVFKAPVARTILTVKDLRVTSAPKNLDRVTLKNGNVLKGNITGESGGKITLDVQLKGGSATLTLERSEIAEIKRGAE